MPHKLLLLKRIFRDLTRYRAACIEIGHIEQGLDYLGYFHNGDYS